MRTLGRPSCERFSSDLARNFFGFYLAVFLRKNEAYLIEAAPGVARLIIEALVRELACLGHIPRACQQLGRPPPVAEHLEGGVDGYLYRLDMAAAYAAEGLFFACGADAQVVPYDFRPPGAFPENAVRAVPYAFAAVVAGCVDPDPVFRKWVAEAGGRRFRFG